jgi:hypothetical protein
MKTKQWNIMLDNNAYEVKISHGSILKKYTIAVNGAISHWNRYFYHC